MQVKNGDYIQMIASLAGDDFSYAPDQVLRVGREIEAGMANALLGPPDEPRARALDKETGERLYGHAQPEPDAFRDDEPMHSEEPAPEPRNDTPGPAADETRDDEPGQGEPQGEPDPAGEQEPQGEQPPEPEPTETRAADGFGDIDEEVQRVREEEQAQQQPQEVERATEPAAETRETATPKRKRRRVKPPEEDEKKED